MKANQPLRTLKDSLEAGGRLLYFQNETDGLPAVKVPFWREAFRLFEPHPIWNDFRHEGYTGFQFYSLSTDCAFQSERFREALGNEIEVVPILRRVDARTYDIHDYLVEIRLGKGCLLATTLHFGGIYGDTASRIEEHPAGAHLLDACRKYLEMWNC